MFDRLFKKKEQDDPEVELLNKVLTREEILVGQTSSIKVQFLKNEDRIVYLRIGSGYKNIPYLDTYYDSPEYGCTSVGYGTDFYCKNLDYVVEKLRLLKKQIQIEMEKRKDTEKKHANLDKAFRDKIKHLG